MPMDPRIALRPITADDREFLLAVYASTREEEMARVDWNEDQKKDFLGMQFDAQDRYYRENYPGYEFQVILVSGIPAGRLYLHRRPAEIRIMDIALLPGFRRQGIGEKLLREILAEGQMKSLPVTIHVEKFNPAFHLYERLGFSLVEDKGVYCFLKWTPSQPKSENGS
jgi:ribosomal protein S18 acetylase RimI-like enzyme